MLKAIACDWLSEPKSYLKITLCGNAVSHTQHGRWKLRVMGSWSCEIQQANCPYLITLYGLFVTLHGVDFREQACSPMQILSVIVTCKAAIIMQIQNGPKRQQKLGEMGWDGSFKFKHVGTTMKKGNIS